MKTRKVEKSQEFERLTEFNCLITWFHQWKNSCNFFFWASVSIVASSFLAAKRVSTLKTSTSTSTFKTFRSIIMQSTLDIKLSNARFRDQAVRQIKSRVSLNKKHQMTQLKIQNQLNSNYDQIRFKSAVSQNRSSFMQKVEILIQEQSAVRHHLPQYIVDEKYVKCIHWINEKYEKLFNSELRFTYDVSKMNNSFVFERHRTMTYEKQIDQWKERQRILIRLWIVKIKAFAKTSKIVRTRESVFKNIKIKMTNVFMSIVVKHQCDLFFHIIRHIDNVKLQQLWKLCDLKDYETIFKIMRAYLKTRKNEFMIEESSSIESFHSYKWFAIDFVTHNDFIKRNHKAVIKHDSIDVASSKLKTKKRSIRKRVKKHWYWEIFCIWWNKRVEIFFQIRSSVFCSAFDIFTQLRS